MSSPAEQKPYAAVTSGVVVNVILWDGRSPHGQGDAVLIPLPPDSQVQTGDRWPT